MIFVWDLENETPNQLNHHNKSAAQLPRNPHELAAAMWQWRED
jgi:hypothetical protein